MMDDTQAAQLAADIENHLAAIAAEHQAAAAKLAQLTTVGQPREALDTKTRPVRWEYPALPCSG
jgi:hypothetical protein